MIHVFIYLFICCNYVHAARNNEENYDRWLHLLLTGDGTGHWRTMRFFQLWLTAWLVTIVGLHLSMSISVTFPNKEPLNVALGKTLVLEAQVQLQPGESILLRTWELKNSEREVRVADTDGAIDNRTFVEKNGALLRINGVTDSDYGLYKLTITIRSGVQVSDSRNVQKIKNPPKAILSMKCSTLSEGAQWDSPVYSWQVDGVNLTNQTGEISTDGSTLLLENLSQSYTCITDSSQGLSKAKVSSKAPEPGPDPIPNGCYGVVWVVLTVIEFIIIAVLIGLYCYKRHTSREDNNGYSEPKGGPRRH